MANKREIKIIEGDEEIIAKGRSTSCEFCGKRLFIGDTRFDSENGVACSWEHLAELDPQEMETEDFDPCNI